MKPVEPNLTDVPLPLPPLPPYVPGYATPYPYGGGMLYYASVPTRPRVWTVFVTILAAFVVGAMAGAVVPVCMVLAENHGKFENQEEFITGIQTGILHPPVLLASGAVTQLVILIAAISAALLSPIPLLKRLRLTRSTLSPLGYLLTPIGALAVSLVFGSLVTLLGIHPGGTLKMMDEVFKKLTPTELAFAIVIVGIAPGFAEEFLFRGYTQTRLVQRWGRWPGILITAFLFGLMHMDPLQSPFAFAFGVYLGYLAEKCGSIRPTMLCHAFNNSVQVFFAWLSAQGGASGNESVRATLFLGLAAAAILAAAIVYIRYAVRPPVEPLADAPPLPSEPWVPPAMPPALG
ncbi:MAG TPA: type II CAAX endopeptidase family protein [Tepidisphaeraceae bacterium]|nr:type II CAAX endopeptidase family protein [Tepidisphaeraceae bacterium]